MASPRTRTKKSKKGEQDQPPVDAQTPPAAAPESTPSQAQETPAEPSSVGFTLTADQSVSYRTTILLAHAEGDDGEMTTDALAAWGAQQPLGWHPEIRDVLIGEKLLFQEEGQTVLTSGGWKRVMAIRDEASAIQLAAKDAELVAHREYANGEKNLLSVIAARKSGVEAARGSLNTAKELLKEAQDELTAYCAQGPQMRVNGSQTTIFQVPGVGKHEDRETGMRPPDWKQMLPGVETDRVVVFQPDKDMPTQEEVLFAKLQPLVFEGDKRVIDASLVVQIFHHPALVTACWHDPVLHESRANLTRLYTVKQWQAQFAKDLGQPVEGQDQTDDAKRQRQTEGAWCGLIVLAGNKKMVVGPQSQAMHIVHSAQIERQDPGAPIHDGKAAAAGDAPEADADGDDEDNED